MGLTKQIKHVSDPSTAFLIFSIIRFFVAFNFAVCSLYFSSFLVFMAAEMFIRVVASIFDSKAMILLSIDREIREITLSSLPTVPPSASTAASVSFELIISTILESKYPRTERK